VFLCVWLGEEGGRYAETRLVFDNLDRRQKEILVLGQLQFPVGVR